MTLRPAFRVSASIGVCVGAWAFGSGCVFAPGSLPDAQLVCASAADCPAPLACLQETRRCVAEGPCVVISDGTATARPAGEPCPLADGTSGACVDGACAAGRCGDGFRGPGEACDDGDDDDTDACTVRCTLAACGDGALHVAERCDDGNTVGGDGCAADCGKVEICGDGIVDEGESCDDANANPSDRCASCRAVHWEASVVVGGAVAIEPQSLFGMARNLDGQVFIADATGRRVVRRDLDGRLVFVAGTGAAGPNGDGGPATSASLDSPTSVDVDGTGRLIIGDTGARTIRVVDTEGNISTLAGGGTIPATTLAAGSFTFSAAVSFFLLSGIKVTDAGDVLIADVLAQRIYRASFNGVLAHVAGAVVPGACALLEDAPADDGDRDGLSDADEAARGTDAQNPDTDGDQLRDGLEVLISADSSLQLVLDPLDPTTGASDTPDDLKLGNGGPATRAFISTPGGITTDPNGNIYFMELVRGTVSRISPSGIIERIAGTPLMGICGTYPPGSIAEDVPALEATLSSPFSIAFTDGALVVTDTSHHTVRRIADDGQGVLRIRTVLGTGVQGRGAVPGVGTATAVNGPSGVIAAEDGVVLVADTGNHRVLRVDMRGAEPEVTEFLDVSTAVAGDGSLATSRELMLSREEFFGPLVSGHGGVLARNDGVVFAETYASRIRRVGADGILQTVAAGPPLVAPAGLLEAPDGSLWVADPGAHQVLRVAADTVQVVVGTGESDVTTDGVQATAATLQAPVAIARHTDGRLFIADQQQHRVLVVNTDGEVAFFAGTGVAGFSGDEGPATAAELRAPSGLALDEAQGVLWIADTGNHRIREMPIDGGTITSVLGNGTTTWSASDDPTTVPTPHGLAFVGGSLLWAEAGSHRVRARAADGTVSLVAGSVVELEASGASGDGTDSVRLATPTTVAIGADGTLVINDALNGRIRRGIPDGDGFTFTTVAGAVDPPLLGPLSSSAALGAVALAPLGAATLVATGNVGRVLRASDDGIAAVVGYRDGGPGAGPRYAPPLEDAAGIAIDDGTDPPTIYVSEAGAGRVSRIIATDIDDPASWVFAPPLEVDVLEPRGLAVDSAGGRLFIADARAHVVIAVDLQSEATSIAAGRRGSAGFFGDGVVAQEALLLGPEAVAVASDGSLYIADTGNHRVRRVDAGGVITTVLGDGDAASSGTGFPARDFSVDTPTGLALDASGNLFIASRNTVRQVTGGLDAAPATGDGEVLTVYGAPPRDAYPANVTRCLTAVRARDDGVIEVADSCQGLVIQLSRTTPGP